ncbi:MAG: hypothetical protein JNL62_04045 [Bryobacterales bacterium]|nr:hypothetical protein [Bryobacterales bacterium]
MPVEQETDGAECPPKAHLKAGEELIFKASARLFLAWPEFTLCHRLDGQIAHIEEGSAPWISAARKWPATASRENSRLSGRHCLVILERP